MKILDEAAVRSYLSMEELIPAMSSALSDLSSKKAVQPVRTILPVAEHKGFLGVMPAYNNALGAKLVTFYPENQGIHTHNGVIILFRPETGEPMALMDGRLITEMRTAAVSAVATDLLANRDTDTLAIIGSGVQARSHLEALRIVRSFAEVRVWSLGMHNDLLMRTGSPPALLLKKLLRGQMSLSSRQGRKRLYCLADGLSPERI